MVRAKKQRKILSVSELSDLKQEKKELESTLTNLQEYGAGTPAESIDKGKIQGDIRKLDSAIREGSPSHVSGQKKDELSRRNRELEEKIREGMPTSEQMRRPWKHPGTIPQNVEWERRNKGLINEWRQNQRMLEPHDPNASSVERLRRP